MQSLLIVGSASLLLASGAFETSAHTLYEGDRPIYASPQRMMEGRAADVDAPLATSRPHNSYGEHAPFPFPTQPWNWW